MGPRWARRPEEGSPQESAGVPANTRERARKKANSELLTFVYWWAGVYRITRRNPHGYLLCAPGVRVCATNVAPKSGSLLRFFPTFLVAGTAVRHPS